MIAWKLPQRFSISKAEVGLLLIFLLFVLVGPDAFSSWLNVKTILTQSVIVAMGALGMTLVIANGSLDLSVGSALALVGVVVGLILKFQWAPWPLALLAGLLVGICASACVGLIHGFFNLNSFLVSLAFMQVFRGIAKGLAEEKTVVAPESPLSLLMLVDPEPDWLMLAPGIWLTLVCAFLVHGLLTRTRIGKYVFAIGSNEKTAVLCGIHVPRYRLLFFVISGFFVGLAGVLQFGNLTVGDPSAGHGYELDLIAACVLGGASLKGGTGSVTGTMVGALAMAVLRNGCNMMGIHTWIQEILIGAVILAVVGLDQLKLKSRSV